jgi:hypothetical protein
MHLQIQVHRLALISRGAYKLIRRKRDENLSFLDAIGRELKSADDWLSSPVFSP